MSLLPSFPAVALGSAVLLLLLYAAYRAVLPKPIPGIPYNHDAAAKVLGDMPEMLRYVRREKQLFAWLTSLTERHRSPIVQAFVQPFSKPWVILTDPYESQDILKRRVKDFDRATFIDEVQGGLLPSAHNSKQTADPRFKENRSLINQLMSPGLLKEISGPETYKSICILMSLWQIKARLADGRPFSAHNDILFTALDAIFAFLAGHDRDRTTIQRIRAVEEWSPSPRMANDQDTPVPFPDAPVPEAYQAALTLTECLTHTQLSPLPRQTWWLVSKLSYVRKATAVKEAFLTRKINEALGLMQEGDIKQDDTPKNGIRSILLRERELALKQGRQPAYHKRAIIDELFGLIQAGHDTTSISSAWGAKLLSDNQAAQARLRSDLQAAIPQAVQERRIPTYEELSAARVPYLDAFVLEVLRCGRTVDFVVREALHDTTVLGHAVPKGTSLWIMGGGAGHIAPLMSLSGSSVRSPGAEPKDGKSLTGLWDDAGIGEFRPERWLVKNGDGEEVCDSQTGPLLAFGLGPRGCFGRRLALATLRLQFSLMVWNFYLEECPPELGGYEAVQKFAREPVRCFVRLRPVIE